MNATEALERLHDIISQPILFAVFGVMCVIFGVSTFVLLFHWGKYAIDKSAIVSAQMIYFLGVAFIIFIALISVILY
jgi:hypothetical protein